MIPQTFTFAVNHLLSQADWARARLAAHGGSRLCLRGRPLLPDMNLAITANGLIEPAHNADAAADLLIVVKAAALPFLLRRHADAMKHIELLGNAGLAADVQHLFQHLEWDAEEDLSRLVGDIAARRIARAGEQFLSWQRDAAERTAQNLAEYFSEESLLLARRADFDRFRLDVAASAQSIERVQARIEALARRTRATAG